MRKLLSSANSAIEGNLQSDSAACLMTAADLGYGVIVLNNVVPITTDFRSHRCPYKTPNNLNIIKRLTVVLSSVSQLPLLEHIQVAKLGYDILALKPLNDSTFKAVCDKAETSIISLDLTSSILNGSTKNAVKAAKDRNIWFEVEFAPFFRDQSSRQSIMTQSRQHLSNLTPNVFVSSAAKNPLELRTVSDLDNFGSAVLGLKGVSSQECGKALDAAVKRGMEWNGVHEA